jgi:hypothetical protein
MREISRTISVASCGFVEQQQAGPGRQRTRNFQASLQAIGQVARNCLGMMGQPDKIQKSDRLVAALFFLLAKTMRTEQQRQRRN